MVQKSMAYLFFIALFFTSPAFAEFGFDDGIRKPQSMVVAGNSIIDKGLEDAIKEVEDSSIDVVKDSIKDTSKDLTTLPVIPDKKEKPIKRVKKVYKKTSTMKVKRSIADDRIDDSYVQGLIKKHFSSSSPIE